MKIKALTLVNIILTTVLLGSILFSAISVNTSSSFEYDPWADTNDDGTIDMQDIFYLILRFNTKGTPINKTALLLELQSKVETRIPKKGYISVPAAAFAPHFNLDFRIDWWLSNLHTTTMDFYGSVQLPNGATVTNVTFYWRDIGDSDIWCELYRYNWTLNQRMAYMVSSGAGFGSSYDDTIAYATVDNSHYAYYLSVWIPYSASHTDYYFQYAVIEYEYQA